jgi:hypothetical protein
LGGTATPGSLRTAQGFSFSERQYMLARASSQDKNACLLEKVFDSACPRMYIAFQEVPNGNEGR